MIRRALSLAVGTVMLRRDPVRYFRAQGAEIGNDVEIFGPSLFTFGSEPYLVTIGSRVTISHGVDFITHDGGMRIARRSWPDAYLYGRVRIGDDCFLGAHCVLLLGACVGDRSIIGAGSMVTGRIPAGVVAAGVPAKPIRDVDEYVEEKRHLWIDTGGLTATEKRSLLEQRLPAPDCREG